MARSTTTLFRILLALACCSALARPARAQTPAAPPADGYVLLRQEAVERFVVQKWISQANPEVSPAGFCECITVIYEGAELVRNLGPDTSLVTVSAVTDLTGDRRSELMVSNYSGGAHCCVTTAIYSVDGAALKPLLSLETADCMGELVDLDKNGAPEFRTCDPVFGYAFCAFAFSPFPPVVYAYNSAQGEFVRATPRYARYLMLVTARDARKQMAEYPNDAEVARCAALAPALGLIYTGRVAQGQRMFRQLYRGADATMIEQKALAMAKQSPMWIER